MLQNPIRAFMDALNGGSRPRCSCPDTTVLPGSPVGPWPPEPDESSRKGIVLRRSEYTQPSPQSVDSLIPQLPGGPRVVFAIAFDDEKGKEVVTVDQPNTGDVTLVNTGDRVRVTYKNRLKKWAPIDWIFVSVDWETIREEYFS